MKNLYEIMKKLELSLGEELKTQYLALLKRWFLFYGSITKLQFDVAARSLLTTKEQIKNHNLFILAVLKYKNRPVFEETPDNQNNQDRGSFEMAEFLPLACPMTMPPAEDRSAESELFLPDSNFIAIKITINAWENGLQGVEDGVTEVMVQACQIFVKNIITAMISRKKGYKIRDGKLQYGFSMPVPNPFIRNTNNIVDGRQESKIEVSDDEDCFVPSRLASLENAEQQTAFAYSCGSVENSDNKLTVKLLYDTIRDTPGIIGFHSLNSVNLLKLGLLVDEPA